MRKQYELGQSLRVKKSFRIYDSEMKESVDVPVGMLFVITDKEDYPETECTFYCLESESFGYQVQLWNDKDYEHVDWWFEEV